MTRSRLVPLALMVTLLLAVVAIAARSRPLGSGGGGRGGLPATFWDYTFTTLVILVVPLMVVGLFTAVYIRRQTGKNRSYWHSLFRSLAIYFLFLGFELLVVRHLSHLRLHRPTPGDTTNDIFGQGGQNQAHHPQHAVTSAPRFRWDELAVILGVLFAVGVGVLIAVMRSRGDPRTPREPAEALAAALDASLDDLLTDPDLRRVIIAAYARMEAALAAAGIPRDPAEAPLEYVERALLSLETSAGAVRRLTELFEWARFSQHEPEPSMRDDAVDALIAVRDELRASELVPA